MGAFIKAIGEQAAGAATSIVGTGLGMALAGWQDRRQLKQQQRLQELQMQGQKQMMDYQQQQTYDMWQKTGPVGQMQQLKAAGLNPALMYGMGGGTGGVTTSPTANVTGGQAHGGSDPLAMGMMLNQARMQQAQIELTEAQASNLQADTENKRGVEREKGYAEIDNLIAGTENTRQVKALNAVRTNLEGLQLRLQEATFDDAVEQIHTNLLHSQNLVEAAARENRIGNATEETAIKMVNLEYAALAAQKALTEANTRLANANVGLSKAHTQLANAQTGLVKKQTEKTGEEITDILRQGQQRWYELELKARGTTATERDASTRQAAQELSEALGVTEAVGKTIFGLLIGTGLGTGGRVSVEGFRRK